MRLSEETGEGDKKSLACFPFCGEWVCTMKISYPFTKHIPVVIVMSVSHVDRYAIIRVDSRNEIPIMNKENRFAICLSVPGSGNYWVINVRLLLAWR